MEGYEIGKDLQRLEQRISILEQYVASQIERKTQDQQDDDERSNSA
jgi:hypothetical protein